MLSFRKIFLFAGCCGTLWGSDYSVTFEEPKFIPLEQSSAMRLETICMMKCLEEVHYAHKRLKSLDFKQIIKEYVEHLDGARMLFIQPEIDEFVKRFASNLDVFLNGGSLTPGFSIFDLYRKKIRDRVAAIFKAIEANQFELFSDRTFIVDRDKEPFQKNQTELEQLWKDRLNFEIVNEIVFIESLSYSRERRMVELSKDFENHIIARLLKKSLKKHWGARTRKDCKTNQLLLPVMATSKIFLKQCSFFANDVYVYVPIYYLDYTGERIPMPFEEKVQHAKQNVLKRYKSMLKNVEQIEPWTVQEQFINSVAQTYDPHTMFMAHETVQDLNMSLHHSFVGIGAYLSDENGTCVVKELIPGGPAAKSEEVQVGDKILSIAQDNQENVDVTGMLLSKVVKLLRGEKGSKVHITLQSANDISLRKTVTLVRDEIELAESRASAKYFEYPCGDHTHKIGVIALPGFYGNSEKNNQDSNSVADVSFLIEKLRTKGVEGIVLDLRENTGGLLDQSVLVGSLFANGPMVQVRGQYGNIDRFFTKNTKTVWEGPLIVLVSRVSASASEILAGMLQDLNRAVIVGDQSTHGKGTVQVVLPMEQLFPKFKNKEDLGASKVTAQKWYRPSGQSIQLKGVESDIVFPSFDSCLPIGEKDLPHAIPWDSINALSYSSYKVTPEIKSNLRDASLKRQESLEEFSLLNDRIAQLKKVVDHKSYAVNLYQRRTEKAADEREQEQINDRIKELVKSNPKYERVTLDIPQRPKQKKLDKKYDKEAIDTHLRETLRIMNDYLELK